MQGGRVALIGVVVGGLAAVGLTRLLATLLFGVPAFDIPTFGVASGAMLVVAIVASYIPARRASAVDPMAALRIE